MCWAYGNSDEDLPHLRLADRAFMINGSKALRAKAIALGVLCVDWR
jgi:phosphoserine phosphatase